MENRGYVPNIFLIVPHVLLHSLRASRGQLYFLKSGLSLRPVPAGAEAAGGLSLKHLEGPEVSVDDSAFSFHSAES